MNSYSMKRAQDNSNIYNSSFGELRSYIYPVYSSFFNNTAKLANHDADKETGTLGKVASEEAPEPECIIKTELSDVPESSDTSTKTNDNEGTQHDLLTVEREEYVIVCDMCDFQSNSHKDMDVHRLSHGLKRNNAMPTYLFTSNSGCEDVKHKTDNKTRKGFVCDLCPYFGKTSTQLMSHKKSHSEEKSYACSQCSYRCKYLSGLRYHQLSHDNTKLFQCHVCTFTCMTAPLLKSHMRKHSSIAPYSCHLCSYTSKYPAGLRYHVLSHTKGKDISCNLCSFACRTPAELKIHYRKHSPESMICEFCGFSCKTKKTMKQHSSVCTNKLQHS